MCLSSVTYLTVRELVQGTCHKVYETRNHLHEYRNKLKSLVKKGITSSANDNIFLAETREVRSGGKYIFLRFIMICCTSESLPNRYVGSSYVVLFWVTHAKKGNFSRFNINSTVRKKKSSGLNHKNSIQDCFLCCYWKKSNAQEPLVWFKKKTISRKSFLPLEFF